MYSQRLGNPKSSQVSRMYTDTHTNDHMNVGFSDTARYEGVLCDTTFVN